MLVSFWLCLFITFIYVFLFLFFFVLFLFKVIKNSENPKKVRTLSKKEIKQQLIDSIIKSDIVETEELTEKINKVSKSDNVATIIEDKEEIIRTKKKSIVCIAYHQEERFRRFKEKQKFIRE